MKQKPRVRKFKYYFIKTPEGEHITVAVSKYHGKNYAGKATCAKSDQYDTELGKEIAAAKCLLKIKKARLTYLHNLWNESLIKRLNAEIEEETLHNLYEQAYAEKLSVEKTVARLQEN